MSRLVKIAIVAPDPLVLKEDLSYDEMVEKVKEHWEKEIGQVLPDNPDIIVVPEVCDRPGNLKREKVMEYYKVRGESIAEFFAQIARENRVFITYPAVRELEDGSFRNSVVLFDRGGKVAGIYDKNHPVVTEIKVGVLPGRSEAIVDTELGRIGFAICFDLNFSELRSKYIGKGVELFLFCSMYHGGDVVQGWWAYSLRSYFVGAIGVRRCPSEVRNPFGEVIASTTNYFDFVVKTINLDYCLAHLDFNWEKLRALKDSYKEEVEIYDPGRVGSVMIVSNVSKSAVEFAREFEIELLDDYFDRSLTEQGWS